MKSIFLKAFLSILLIIFSTSNMENYYISGFIGTLLGFFSLMNQYINFLKSLP